MRGTSRWGCDFFFFQAEDGIRDLVRSRGLGDVYKRQGLAAVPVAVMQVWVAPRSSSLSDRFGSGRVIATAVSYTHLTLPTSDLV